MADPDRTFADLGLPAALLDALAAVGYETPTPIQARTLPPLLDGRDVLGHAPTGTGKTAAFALPILARLDPERSGVQALVLTPTRELAIQVAEAFTRYASAMPRLRVLPIYGGQDYGGQLKALSRGVQVVVGTPGRVSDHLRRRTLSLAGLKHLVLDEGDEMLRMGFVDDVEWILDQTPSERQTALFSATMPPPIRRIARKHLRDPEEIGIEGRRSAATTIRQRVWTVRGMSKLDALTRLLEVERFDAMLIFVRTKSSTVELAEKLEARGFAAQAMNGDMPQKERERQVDKLKRGNLDILVATDVVARGLDVERISHVVNFDIPHDTESYVHRIGRTGRAGRSGDAILFVAPRERRMLGAIEKATSQRIENLELPSVAMVNERRVEAFQASIDEILERHDIGYLETLVKQHAESRELPVARVAAALARMALGDRELHLNDRASRREQGTREPAHVRKAAARAAERTAAKTTAPTAVTPDVPADHRENTQPSARKSSVAATAPSSTAQRAPVPGRPEPQSPPRPGDAPPKKRAPDKQQSNGRDVQPAQPPSPTPQATPGPRAKPSREKPSREGLVMERYRVEVGSTHGTEVSNIVGAIASEADIQSEFIGRVTVNDDHSIVELPEGMPKFMVKELRRVWVSGRQLGLRKIDPPRATGSSESRSQASAEPGKKRNKPKPSRKAARGGKSQADR